MTEVINLRFALIPQSPMYTVEMTSDVEIFRCNGRTIGVPYQRYLETSMPADGPLIEALTSIFGLRELVVWQNRVVFVALDRSHSDQLVKVAAEKVAIFKCTDVKVDAAALALAI